MAGPLGVGSPWSAFVGSGGSAGLQRFTSIALACPCSSGVRLVVPLSSVLVSRGGSRWFGGGSFSPVGCVRRVSVLPGRLSSPFRAKETSSPKAQSQGQLALRCRYTLKRLQNKKPTPPAKRREFLLSCRLRLRPLSRGKPPQNSRPLAGPQGNQRLTRRLFTALHSAPLPVGPAPTRNPHRAAEANESGGTAPARGAKPP